MTTCNNTPAGNLLETLVPVHLLAPFSAYSLVIWVVYQLHPHEKRIRHMMMAPRPLKVPNRGPLSYLLHSYEAMGETMRSPSETSCCQRSKALDSAIDNFIVAKA